jgi:hypothetical protein
MSPEDYETLLVQQGGVCAICRQGVDSGRFLCGALNVDHDHKTGIVRGLLCGFCNCAIGKLNDDPDLLDRAAVYLRDKSSVVSNT